LAKSMVGKTRLVNLHFTTICRIQLKMIWWFNGEDSQG